MATPVKRRRKKAHELTTEDVLKRVFRKTARQMRKLIADALSDERKPRKRRKSKSQE